MALTPPSVVPVVLLAAAIDAVARGRAPAARLRTLSCSVRADQVAGPTSLLPTWLVPTRLLPFGRVRRGARRGDDDALVRQVVEAWARALRAGAAVPEALADAVADIRFARELLRSSSSAAATGADLPTALRADAARLPPAAARAVRAASACAAVAHSEGARLADALDHLADALRADEQHRAHVRAQLAGPRATARLLAALPVLALVMASGAGMDVRSVVLEPGWGLLAVACAVALDVVGIGWTARIARAAEQSV
jgi:tight adherence protein B